jgi:predicted FMN-binding regulatory protein PaiB
MIDYPYYRPSPAALTAFIGAQRMGRLVTADADGRPHIGLYPFVPNSDAIELHLVKTDAQIADLRQNPHVIFEVDEILTFVPSYLEHLESAQAADHYYRAAILEGEARVTTDAEAVADHLRRLVARYQPERGYREVSAADPLYAPGIARLAMIRIDPTRVWGKFKHGQQVPAEHRTHVSRGLRARGHDAIADLFDRGTD